MARKYINPNRPAAGLVTDELLDAARERVASTAARLQLAEAADPSAPGWEWEYEASTTAARAAERRLEALESLRARQVEGAGRRAAAVKASATDLQSITSYLVASRDQVAAAAADHLRALAALSAAADAHNQLLATSRAQVAALGLQVRDDLLDEGSEHPEGTMDGGGLRAGGVDWTPVPAAGLVAGALTATFGVFRGPFAALRFAWPAHQTTTRPDGLRVPSLEDAGVTLPPAPVPLAVPSRASVGDLGPPSMTQAELAEQNRTGFLRGRRSA
jgi:hypothetical protein